MSDISYDISQLTIEEFAFVPWNGDHGLPETWVKPPQLTVYSDFSRPSPKIRSTVAVRVNSFGVLLAAKTDTDWQLVCLDLEGAFLGKVIVPLETGIEVSDICPTPAGFFLLEQMSEGQSRVRSFSPKGEAVGPVLTFEDPYREILAGKNHFFLGRMDEEDQLYVLRVNSQGQTTLVLEGEVNTKGEIKQANNGDLLVQKKDGSLDRFDLETQAWVVPEVLEAPFSGTLVMGKDGENWLAGLKGGTLFVKADEAISGIRIFGLVPDGKKKYWVQGAYQAPLNEHIGVFAWEKANKSKQVPLDHMKGEADLHDGYLVDAGENLLTYLYVTGGVKRLVLADLPSGYIVTLTTNPEEIEPRIYKLQGYGTWAALPNRSILVGVAGPKGLHLITLKS